MGRQKTPGETMTDVVIAKVTPALMAAVDAVRQPGEPRADVVREALAALVERRTAERESV